MPKKQKESVEEDDGPKGDFASEEQIAPSKKNRKEKPWDSDNIDHWDMGEYNKFERGDMKSSLTEESSFATLFPKYRESYLKAAWPAITKALEKFNIDCVLNLVEGTMTVKTTKRTWDPYSILKARDLIRLLSRSVPVEQAIKIMQDDMWCEIIKIGGMVQNQERFAKRRQRLVGPGGSTLKAIEILTQCYVLVQGKTVVVMGSFRALPQVRKIVVDCMNNIHPIYNIKEMMIKRELQNDDNLKTDNWERFLPKFYKKTNDKKKKKKPIKKKEYTPFPPEPQQRKVDLMLESGEYFLSEQAQRAAKKKEKREATLSKLEEKAKKKAQSFVPPKEKDYEFSTSTSSSSLPSAEDVKGKIQGLKKRKTTEESTNAQDFILSKKVKK
eukprot:TRINITY_DN11999_c0_g1_i1.p1 TRINITY_DN11999_c0_g1~~TRINITY_DN11999_c0_g1_i1.p1  ORF type:complete len:384 (-),score=97.54 TRINITY_DN11999_c0_g1_i1:64-1215(-)